MVIRKIEICNFRIFYKDNTFELSDGLNLILGWHGDGKSTFLDALEWLFRTDGTNKMDTKFISKKRSEELFCGDSDNVRVAMTYEHKGKTKVLEKTFRFTKSIDGEVGTSNYSFSLIEQNGAERVVKDGVFFDRDVPSEIRKFIMFKGDADLDILRSSVALKILVDNFSDMKDFDAYFDFMEYATKKANQARDYAQKLDKKNSDRIKKLNKTIEQERIALTDLEREIQLTENEAVNYEELLKEIENGHESSMLLVAVNRRIENLRQKRYETEARIREDYTSSLLQDMWVLLGFNSIAEEYSSKVNNYERIRRKAEHEYLIEEGLKRAKALIETGVNEHKEMTPFFRNNFVSELRKQASLLELHLPNISKLRNNIQEIISLNDRLHDEIKKLDIRLEEELMQKKRMLAQADGLSEEKLLANYTNIANWMDKRNQAENRIYILKRQREVHRTSLEDAESYLNKMFMDTDFEKHTKKALMFHHISEAFKTARGIKIERSIMEIEDKVNMFLCQLLPDDFTGTIRIIEKYNGQCEMLLVDGDDNRIYFPNYHLRKNIVFAFMLAIGELMAENYHMEYPLIFDGSLSDYDNDYGNPLVENVNRQMIVFTSDFMTMDETGNRIVSEKNLPSISNRVYRIEKKTPFDSRKLGTMQVCISKIK